MNYKSIFVLGLIPCRQWSIGEWRICTNNKCSMWKRGIKISSSSSSPLVGFRFHCFCYIWTNLVATKFSYFYPILNCLFKQNDCNLQVSVEQYGDFPAIFCVILKKFINISISFEFLHFIDTVSHPLPSNLMVEIPRKNKWIKRSIDSSSELTTYGAGTW